MEEGVREERWGSLVGNTASYVLECRGGGEGRNTLGAAAAKSHRRLEERATPALTAL